MPDDNNNTTPDDLAAVARSVRDIRETTEPLFEAMLKQGERTTSLSEGLVGISQATIEERLARLEELDPAITEIVQMLRRRLDELERRVTALEAAGDT
jgi:vacuolar-type H+-ATPase subunit E/Vma4